MSEQQFLEILNKQQLKTRKAAPGKTSHFRIALGDGHTLVVMFDPDSKCSGIQRVRGEDADDPAAGKSRNPGEAQAVRDAVQALQGIW